MPLNVILWDGHSHRALLPFTFTRPVGLIRIGILTVAEKYGRYLEAQVSFLTEDYLKKRFPAAFSDDNLLINATILPDKAFINACKGLEKGKALARENEILAVRGDRSQIEEFISKSAASIEYPDTISRLLNPWDIFSKNGEEISKDFSLITKGRKSRPIPEGNYVRKPENIFIEEGAKILNASLNAEDGPIYIGKDAEIMEGSLVRGPFALGEHSTLKLGAKIYGPTTIGPHCKVGGEVNNSVFFGYANKAHDGFIGNAVIGEWCNIGADSNNSNLKNNYDEVKVWNYDKKGFVKTGLQFCGLFMGDHSKCGINTMFNTGTVVGVSANIFGAGFPRTYVPSFSWGGAAGFTTYALDKALETARLVLARRGMSLSDEDKAILGHIFAETEKT
jgi:UDP-N-acetylglucosamine diphosphorylase/glucosamine-1-phosphate N-acetyltransferase